MHRVLLVLFSCICLYAHEPILPIPQSLNVDIKKAKLGKELFCDTILSRDYSTSCLSCHDIYSGGADSRIVSFGFDGKKGNIQSPTVFNAVFNASQFWNGRAKDLYEQAAGPLANPVEHNMDKQSVEDRLNDSKKYKKLFKNVYGVSHITFHLALDAIVEFEKALITPNSKFDRYLRGEVELSSDEKEGYIIFKKYGCVTCHNGVNIGANSYQKMGTFFEYNISSSYPDRSLITKNAKHKNVFKVPTLRNITLTAPYFHDGSAPTLKEAIDVMSKHNLGIVLSEDEVNKMVKFLHTLDGVKPKILELK